MKYTAMRLFQEIEGAEVFYINTYAATTPRLPVFKNICNHREDKPADPSSSCEAKKFIARTVAGQSSDQKPALPGNKQTAGKSVSGNLRNS